MDIVGNVFPLLREFFHLMKCVLIRINPYLYISIEVYTD